MIEKIEHNNLHLATLVRAQYEKDGIEFCTDDHDPLQLGYMKRPEGYEILPHTHNVVERSISATHEVLFIKTGKVRVDFFDNEQNYIFSIILGNGDVILLADGGHGFKMLEPSEIIEGKQGPYLQDKDKNRFESIRDQQVTMR